MNENFWNGKKVLITGNTGFKGAWLSRVLISFGAEVCGYALKNDCPDSIFNAIGLEKQMHCCYGDICDYERLSDFIEQTSPELVFHLAAQPIVRESYRAPVYTYQTNVMGTVTLFDCLRKAEKLRAVINVTTDKVYANDDKTGFFSETDRLGGYDPYSNSKACSELITSSYVLSFFNPEKYGTEHKTAVATARAGNVIGGGDYAPDRLIPDCIRAVKRGESVFIRNPDSVRPWQNVLEPVSAYITLAERLYTDGTAYSGAYNIGPEKEDCLRVAEVIEKLQQYITELKVESGSGGSGMHEAQLLTLNSQKIKKKLGFCSRWKIDDAVKYTALWYENQLRGADMSVITDEIIKKYYGI